MRNFFAAILVLAFASVASADVGWTVVVGDQIDVVTLSPGATCTYGGISVSNDPLLGATVTGNFCFPGNTGPTGATGATGPTGATGATGAPGLAFEFVDDEGDAVPNTTLFGVDPVYIDAQYRIWDLDPQLGLIDEAKCVTNQPVYYSNFSCTGTPFTALTTDGRISCRLDKVGDAYWWEPIGSRANISYPYSWNGTSCAQHYDPSPKMLLADVGYPADLSSYSAPFRAAVRH
jgi:hypothetical protein